MRTAARIVLVLVGLAAFLSAAAFLFGFTPITALWPYGGYAGMGPVFVASILAAIGAPALWIGVSGDLAGLRPGAVNVLVISSGLAVQAFLSGLGGFGLANASVAVVMVAAFYLARREPWRDERPTPWPVRAAFIVFAVGLVIVGGGLMGGQPLFPWVLSPNLSAAYGIIFLGAASYFTYGLLVPVWSNARGQLIGFLAYDLVLAGPFVQRWPQSGGEQQLSLTIYLAVILGSGVLAVTYLFLRRRWRIL